MKLSVLPLAAFAAAQSTSTPPIPSAVQPLVPAISSIFPSGAPLTPQILQTFLEPNEINLARNSYVYRNGAKLLLNGNHWTASGANVYWLGLDENVIPPAGSPFYAPFNASYPTHGRITEAMSTLATLGARLVRSHTLGISVGNPLSVMPTLGVVNNAAFDTIDWSVFQARQHGLRLMIPLVDNWDYYHGGKFTFLRWAGFDITGSQSPLPATVNQFYTNATVIQSFKNYIQVIMTHVNPYTGLTYAQDPTIIAYETGNELDGMDYGAKNVPTSWVREICQYIKKLGPQKLCMDGTNGVNTTHFEVTEVDMFTQHYYPLSVTQLNTDIASVLTTNRVYIAGEIDWTGLDGTTKATGDSLTSFYNTISQRQSAASPVVAGSLFWSLFGRNLPDCSVYVNHTDGFTMHYGSPSNTASQNSQISIMRKHFLMMQNISIDTTYLPAVPCPENYVPGSLAEYTYP